MTTTTSTTSTSATQSLVSQLGAGSGIDMAALATNLANAQFASKVDRLTAKSETLTAQISAASNMKAMLLNFSTSVGDLVRTGGLSPQPQFSGASVASGALSGTRTPSGSYSLEVTTLAKSQTLASAAYTSPTATTDVVGPGTLKLSFGTISGTNFAPDADPKRVGIAIPIAANATLNDVANAVNAQKTGVTAYVAQTSAGAQLVFKGAEGAANGFKIEADTSGLGKLAWDPATSPTTDRLIANAGDASFKVDGLVRTSTSNTVSEAIPGVTLKLTAVSTGTPPVPTTVTFTDTSAALSTTMNDLTGALNEIASALNAATDPTSGDLRADSGARALKKAFGQLAGSTVMPNATGAAKTLADLGLSTQRDGTFVLDTNRLKATLAKDPDGVASMFTTGLYGVYATVDKLYRNATAASDPGSLGGSITRFTKQLSQVKEDQTTVAEKQETLRANLTARFAVSDSRISASQSTLSFIQNQIAAWNKSDS
ncbi:flagellar hook-associated protein 2 [Novosphingobium chloroacetimidivorans]|uniref:Flagellar hook-associated protein 2 n=1 Tax=Novosphingobium chloroacetimidivorans TaxID=1428314 RepID=A0A7W7K8C8_9SPHN|nr:flagellar filament capping protein FliD [Novosphingobium chloroacetimidivorans]MBB4858086.1 flagellar hook-associated protein 2 [Novosphingobium chloroacetimidivorans]